MTTTRFSRGSGRKRFRLGRRPTLELMESRTLLATFTVTSIGDNGGVDPVPGAGTGTLRQAIVDANNAAGADDIVFNIAGAGPHVIAPAAALPALSDVVTIDGFTQAGASANTLTNGNDAVYQIVLDGTGAGVGSDGLQLVIGSDQSTIRGLVIQNFSGDGIEINSSSLNTIEGNFIGTTLDGSTAAPNGGNGVFIIGVNEAADQNTVGGSTPDARNLISHGRA